MLYNLGFLIFSIFYIPTLLFKGKLHGDFLERFGVYKKAKLDAIAASRGGIWIQAVSVGEVALCKTLVPAIKEKFPDKKIIISTITKGGNDLAKKLFSEDAVIIYFPLDFSFIAKKAVGILKPKLYIMVETEIWPNVLKTVNENHIPAILINGRISDHSFGKYKLVSLFLKNILAKIGAFCMQSEVDAERIRQLGAPKEKVMVTGTMKFDAEVKTDASLQQKTRELLGLEPGNELFVAGSTHEGEEAVVISAYAELIRQFPKLKLLIAPRHVDRAARVEALARKIGFETERVSNLNERRTLNHSLRSGSGQATKDERRILILDTIGQLQNIYTVATIVFIGGSLVKHGGQNPIEPAILERPILFGPNMFNFRPAEKVLLDNSGAIKVSGESELFNAALRLLKDPEDRARLGANAKSAILKSRGATGRNIELISTLIADS